MCKDIIGANAKSTRDLQTMHFVAFHKFFVLLVGMVPITLDISLDIFLKVPRLIFIKNQKEEGEFLANAFPSPIGI